MAKPTHTYQSISLNTDYLKLLTSDRTDSDERNSNFYKNSTILANMILSASSEENLSLMQNYSESNASTDLPGISSSNEEPYISLKNTPPYLYPPSVSVQTYAPLQPLINYPLNSKPLPLVPCHRIGPYDIVEFRATSLHSMRKNREALRIIAVAAGENLHNVYRVLMASLCQREDRARLVFHAWILPDGSVYGNGSRNRESTTLTKTIKNDREIYLNQLPIHVGYQLQLVFGKCIYNLIIQDLLLGINDEQDLIWTPRVCEGSYGEAVPFDLCYSPHLFSSPSPRQHKVKKHENLVIKVEENAVERLNVPVKLEDNDPDSPGVDESCDSASPSLTERLSQIRPTTEVNRLLSPTELDDINRNLSRMRFIRQYSQIKPLLRKNRPEDYIPDEEKRRHCFRMTVRLFFSVLWNRYSTPPAIDNVNFSQYIHFSPTTSPNIGLPTQQESLYRDSFTTSHGIQTCSDTSITQPDENNAMTFLKAEDISSNMTQCDDFTVLEHDSLEKDKLPSGYTLPQSNFSNPLVNTVVQQNNLPLMYNSVALSSSDRLLSPPPVSSLDVHKVCLDFPSQFLNLGTSYPRCRVSKRRSSTEKTIEET